jgi:hypothetical protein
MARGREHSAEPLTLGQALAAHVRLIVWCKSCNHQAEPDVGARLLHGAINVAGQLRLALITTPVMLPASLGALFQ